jgi:hypothetical protein
VEPTPIVISDDETAGPMRWEPCAQAHLDDVAGVCADCGWPIDDHRDEDRAGWAARAA